MTFCAPLPMTPAMHPMNAPELPSRSASPQFSHGGGCGCKIAPGVLQRDPRRRSTRGDRPAGAARRHRDVRRRRRLPLNEHAGDRRDDGLLHADRRRSVRLRRHRRDQCASPTSTRWAARRSSRWRSSACRSNQLPLDVIRAILEGGEIGLRARRHSGRGRPHDRFGRADLRARRDRRSSIRATSSATPARVPGDVLMLGKPLGVGIYSAALKRDALVGDGLPRR